LKRDRPTGFTRFKEGITNLEIVPTSINYSSFSKKTKDSIIHFNASFKPETLTKTRSCILQFVYHLSKVGILQKMIVKNDLSDVTLFPKSNSTKITRILLAIPALIGF
jgi:hypothetical protein